MQDNHTEESWVDSFPLVFNAPPAFFKWVYETTGVELVLREIFNYFKMFFNLRLIPLRSLVLINVLSGYSAVQRRSTAGTGRWSYFCWITSANSKRFIPILWNQEQWLQRTAETWSCVKLLSTKLAHPTFLEQIWTQRVSSYHVNPLYHFESSIRSSELDTPCHEPKSKEVSSQSQRG